jgi:glyoxalase family protein
MNIMKPIEGLHHITAVARDAQKNVDFYRNILGQRLVKRTVNFDDPSTYHFYFADAAGTPGSVLTFFAWSGISSGARGNGASNALAYNVPENALEFWQEHLRQNGVQTLALEERFGAQVLGFDDPDGLRLELVGSPLPAETQSWNEGPVDPRFALQGFHSSTLWLEELDPTAALLTKEMGYTYTGQQGSRHRFTGGPATLGSVIDIIHRPAGDQAVFGAGSVHHIAFRVPDDPSQLDYRQALLTAGLGVTAVRDRSYFHSIYFREPGGVLFEIATNNPGFATDEPAEKLGEALKLPEWLEPQRFKIENALSPLSLKAVQKVEYEPQN